MENDHQAYIERLKLMYRESQEQSLCRNKEFQALIAKVTKLLSEALKEKGQTSTIDMEKESINPNSNLNGGIEATSA